MLTIQTSIPLPGLPTLGWLGRLARRLSRQALQYHQHHVTVIELTRLNDRLLRDIGVERRPERELALFDPAARNDVLWFPAPLTLQ